MAKFELPFMKNRKGASVSSSASGVVVKQGLQTSSRASEKSVGRKSHEKSRKLHEKRLTARSVSFGIVAAVCLYLVLMPFLPLIPYYFREFMGMNEYRPVEVSTDGSKTNREGIEKGSENIPKGNTLRIPAVGIDVNIVEGNSDKALDKGAWHRPGTGDPLSGGNMVVTGHRFKYLPPSNLTFYNLDKIVVGDRVIVYWNGTRYDYEVSKIHVVTPDQIEVEAPTVKPQLTLYTCTPLWTAKLRLVIVALPVDAKADTIEE